MPTEFVTVSTRRAHFLPGQILALALLVLAMAGAVVTPAGAEEFRTLEWTDLMPEDDLQALLNPPEALAGIEDGSAEDQIANELKNTIAQASDDRYQQALVSNRVISELDGQAVRIPGFIVPLEFSGERQVVTRFFLVPYFGACIHMPPPPPNQIVYAEYEEGFKLESLYTPFWISGTLQTTLVENDTATAAYSIAVERFEPYAE